MLADSTLSDMLLLRNKFAFALTTVLFIVLGLTQSILFLFSSYPDALRDLFVNQGIVNIDNAPITMHPHSRVGRAEMRQSTATFVGVGKKVDMVSLSPLLVQIEKMGSMFKEARVLLVLDDFDPGLHPALESWVQAHPDTRQVISSLPPAGDEKATYRRQALPREGKITTARNVALDTYRQGVTADYLIQIDTDIVGWDLGGIEDSFGQADQWDAVCANGVILYGIYRDVYAFRAPGIVTNHHLSGLDHLDYNISVEQRHVNRNELKRSKRTIHRWLDGRGKSLNREAETGSLLSVDSCFGGLTIYKNSVLDKCQYDYRHREEPRAVDCEHVIFHQCLREQHNARITTNRNMKVWYGHTLLNKLNYLRVYNSLMES